MTVLATYTLSMIPIMTINPLLTRLFIYLSMQSHTASIGYNLLGKRPIVEVTPSQLRLLVNIQYKKLTCISIYNPQHEIVWILL